MSSDGYGRNLAGGFLPRHGFCHFMGSAPAAWADSTAVTTGDRVTNAGNIYECTSDGTTASGPSGTGAAIADGSVEWDYVTVDPWADTTPYGVGDLVTNDGGKLYVCTVAGTSDGSGGPTGTGSGIADNDVEWDFVASPAWTANTTQVEGDHITNDSGKFYVCITAGTTAAGPSGAETAIEDGTAEWKYVSETTDPTTVWKGQNARCFRVGIAGNVTVTMESGDDVTVYNVSPGETWVGAFSKIVSADTTAEKITVRWA